MTETAPISVAVVEDNGEICEGLARLIDAAPGLVCTGAFRNAATALRKIPQLGPRVVVMDIQLPGMSGIACTGQLRRLMPDVAVLMLTVYEDAEQILRALEAGASGYLLKSASPERVIEAIREIARGGVPMSDDVARKVIRSFHKPAPAAHGETLTTREEEVLKLLARGFSAKEIGSELFISSGTVSNHLKHIYRKLHVRSRVEAVISYRG